MIRNIFAFFSGYCQLTVSEKDRLNIAELLRSQGCPCLSTHTNSDGSYVFKITLPAYLRLKNKLAAADIDFVYSGVKGIPSLILYLLHRPGLAVGIILFTALMYISSNMIWNINVTGNSSLSDREIIYLLDDLGCGYGDWIPSIDFDKLHSEYLIRCDGVSWISVNMKGTVANVQLREKRYGGNGDAPDGVYANIIASDDAQIISAEIYNGQVCVSRGDIVKKGDLLISGVLHIREDEFDLEYASGEILAYVSEHIQVEIPLVRQEKRYTGSDTVKKSIKIFKKSINLSPKGGIEHATYDKIVENERLYLFDTIPLPVWYEETELREYTYEQGVSDYSLAVSEGVMELRHKLDTVLENAQLVSNKMTTGVTEDSVTITCDIICIKDIAQVSEFSADTAETE